MAIQKYPGTSLEDLRSLLSYSSDSPTHSPGPFHAPIDSTPPPTSKAIFLRDEKSQVARMEEDDLLDKCCEGSKRPRMMFGLIPTQAFMLPYSMLMTIAFALMAGKAAGSETSPISVLGAIATAGVHILVFVGMLLEEHVLMAIAGIAAVGKLSASVLNNIVVCYALYDRKVCSMMPGMSPRECLANLGLMRTLVPLLLVAQIVWEAYLVKQIANVVKYTAGKGGKMGKYARLHDVDTMVGHSMA